MVARTDGEFTHAEAHYLGVAYPGNFADYYIRVIQPSGSQVITGTGGGGISSGTSSTGTVIVQPIKLYTRDYGSNADTGTLLLYPASSTDNEIIISTWTD